MMREGDTLDLVEISVIGVFVTATFILLAGAWLGLHGWL